MQHPTPASEPAFFHPAPRETALGIAPHAMVGSVRTRFCWEPQSTSEDSMSRLLASLLLVLTPLLASAEEVIRVYNWNY